MTLERRTLLGGFAGAAAIAPLLALEAAAAKLASPQQDATTIAAEAHERLMQVPGLQMHGEEEIAMLLYPGFTALDLVGPHYFFACMMGAKVHLVTNQANLAPVASDLGLAIAPTKTLADCPADLTLVFCPGGTYGTIAAASDRPTLAFLKDRAARAQCVASVCTGSVILGAAGLLKGRKATSHWVAREQLSHFGATPIDQRVVKDGKVVTGAGVSAGLDLGLAIVEALRGRPYAEALMLQAEYSPAPPFPGGTPANTDPAITGPMNDMFTPFRDQMLKLPSLP
ncbi:DJ-1/PfpI family protein [Caulobacter vibrioides]|uniref:DJ-1/PfpI family protein n=1 Tax=Caulobacter vibrioides TaxID=155892 RepID=A0A2S1B7J9_CAUVI|nr:DJ-1/PfpI family protein [Caulobacter vibrioides]AWC68658.1 DJ-1/PfpI family protein [Caulobacter vibrioides]